MGEKEVVLSVVPMFHVNAWGLPYSCTMAGAKQVLPGPMMIGKPIADLIESEKVTSAAGVPTIWALLYQYLKEEKERTYDLSSLKTILVGGAAASQTLVDSFEKDLGLPILHAWGMTETSPIGTVSRLKSTMHHWTDEQKMAVRLKQGIPVVGRRGPHPRRSWPRPSLGWRARGRTGRARAVDRQELLQQPRR